MIEQTLAVAAAGRKDAIKCVSPRLRVPCYPDISNPIPAVAALLPDRLYMAWQRCKWFKPLWCHPFRLRIAGGIASRPTVTVRRVLAQRLYRYARLPQRCQRKDRLTARVPLGLGGCRLRLGVIMQPASLSDHRPQQSLQQRGHWQPRPRGEGGSITLRVTDSGSHSVWRLEA